MRTSPTNTLQPKQREGEPPACYAINRAAIAVIHAPRRALARGCYRENVRARSERYQAGFRAAAEEDTTSVASACHLIPDEVLGKVSDLLGEGKATLQEYGYVLCDEPASDPSITCFLRPDNWEAELGSEPGSWVCMANPSHTATPSMTPEDSY